MKRSKEELIEDLTQKVVDALHGPQYPAAECPYAENFPYIAKVIREAYLAGQMDPLKPLPVEEKR